MSPKLAARLEQRAMERFDARESELANLLAALGPEGPVVTHIHGVGGIGKSRLVEVFGSMARAKGNEVIHLDCRAVEPSPKGFVRALALALASQSYLSSRC